MPMPTDIGVFDLMPGIPGDDASSEEDYIAYTPAQLDKHGIERAMIGLGFGAPQERALRENAIKIFKLDA